MTVTADVDLDAIDWDSLEPEYIGPTWSVTPLGLWALPERTLGWQIAGWCSEYLAAEGHTEDDPKPWNFTDEQLRFLLWWYATDENGRFIYRKGVLQRMKGWGKDPLLAVLCMVELVGPSRFSHFDAEGVPIGKAHPQAWVQVTAVNQSQTTNTMALIPSLMTERFKQTYQVEPGAVLIRAMGGKVRLEAVTSSYRALEGKRTTFTLLNETHHWVLGNHGHQMYETIDGNATKMDSRYLAITNAYLPGEDSVAERMRDSWEKITDGLAADVGFLYDSVEAPETATLDPDCLRALIPKIRGDAVWINPNAVIASVMDTSIPPSRSRRMWLNQIVAGEDALYDRKEWSACFAEVVLMPNDEIVLGFDGGKTDDDTALVAMRVRDRAVFVIGHWFAPEGPAGKDWIVDKEAVDKAVREAHKTYKVRGMYADVALWESYIDAWARDFGGGYAVKSSASHPVAWDMRGSLKRSTVAHERLMSSIRDANLIQDGDRALRRHVLNTRARENNWGTSFGKESRESKRKVDLYAAMMLAHECLNDLALKGKPQKERTGRGYFT